jgi:hypothetical protein
MMKKLLTIIFCFIAFSTYSFAQTPYLPTEQLETARTEAAKVLTSPQLISAATINGTIPGLELLGTPIPISFDMADGAGKGKATGWVYFFNSTSEPQNIQAIAIGVTMLGVLPFNLTQMGKNLGALSEYASSNSLDSKQWMNSDAMIPYLKASEPYTTFMTTYPSGKPKYVVLGYADYANLDPNTPYWFVTMSDPADSLLIVVNALNGAVTGVEDKDIKLSNSIVYPNPAIDYTIVQSQMPIPSYLMSVKIYDNIGNLVSEQKIISNSQLDLNGLINGKYFIHVNSGKENQVFPLVINK